MLVLTPAGHTAFFGLERRERKGTGREGGRGREKCINTLRQGAIYSGIPLIQTPLGLKMWGVLISGGK